MQKEKIEKLWQNFHKELKFFILKRVNCKEDAEDILQEVFIKIQKNIGKLNEEKTLKSWLYKITRNTVIDYYRTRKISQNVTDDILENMPDEKDIDENDNNDIKKCVEVFVKNLPEKQRFVIKYTDYFGKSQKELAEKLNTSYSGAKSRVQRARKEVKRLMEDCCVFKKDKLGNVVDMIERKCNTKNCKKVT